MTSIGDSEGRDTSGLDARQHRAHHYVQPAFKRLSVEQQLSVSEDKHHQCLMQELEEFPLGPQYFLPFDLFDNSRRRAICDHKYPKKFVGDAVFKSQSFFDPKIPSCSSVPWGVPDLPSPQPRLLCSTSPYTTDSAPHSDTQHRNMNDDYDEELDKFLATITQSASVPKSKPTPKPNTYVFVLCEGVSNTCGLKPGQKIPNGFAPMVRARSSVFAFRGAPHMSSTSLLHFDSQGDDLGTKQMDLNDQKGVTEKSILASDLAVDDKQHPRPHYTASSTASGINVQHFNLFPYCLPGLNTQNDQYRSRFSTSATKGYSHSLSYSPTVHQQGLLNEATASAKQQTNLECSAMAPIFDADISDMVTRETKGPRSEAASRTVSATQRHIDRIVGDTSCHTQPKKNRHRHHAGRPDRPPGYGFANNEGTSSTDSRFGSHPYPDFSVLYDQNNFSAYAPFIDSQYRYLSSYETL
jgi:hypothetical protein